MPEEGIRPEGCGWTPKEQQHLRVGGVGGASGQDQEITIRGRKKTKGDCCQEGKGGPRIKKVGWSAVLNASAMLNRM